MMKIKILRIGDACTGCGACASICPKKCLRIQADKEGFFYPSYDNTNCIECGLCEKACHILSPLKRPSPNRDRFFLYHSYDKNLLQSSSSGGGFSLFADWIMKQGGIVFGSRYNYANERLEVFSTEETSIESLRKSKYLESFTGNTFKRIRIYLEDNKRVLYCGTPCQVRGLKTYLKATNTNTTLLLTIDFACHGVPSNLFFNQFKNSFETQKRKVVDVDFRHKDFSKNNMKWHNMTLKLLFSDGKESVYPRFSRYYYYYEPFLENLTLRKSCYYCDFAIHSEADVTLGDFWGIHNYRTELDDNMGMSFVSINNQDILPLWRELSSVGFSEQLPFEKISYQYLDKRDKRINQIKKRNGFVEDILKIGYMNAVVHHYGRIFLMKLFLKYKLRIIIKTLLRKE